MNVFWLNLLDSVFLKTGIFILYLVFIPTHSFANDFNHLRLFISEPIKSLIFKNDYQITPNGLSVSIRTGNDSQAIGELMFNTSDVVLMNREFTKLELAPYIHQYSGDMMKTPFATVFGYFDGEPVYLFSNKRVDASLPPNVLTFTKYVLNDFSFNRLSKIPKFKTLSKIELENQLKTLDFFIPHVDSEMFTYDEILNLQGEISSVGSDGMKNLMDDWFKEFASKNPKVKHGQIWEHLGTLNGFHALMVNQTDIAPMGRELWPEEAHALNQSCPECKMLELKVAHGGFNTQQRTTVQSFFVNKNNPIRALTLDQLRQIWGVNPKIKTWGELGLTGEWSQREINLFAPPLIAPNARSIQFSVLGWGKWAQGVKEGSIPWVSQQVFSNEGALGFGGLEDMSEDLKSIQISISNGSPAVSISAESVSNRTYPLPRYMYIRAVVQKGKPLKPQIFEFLKFVISKSAQNMVPYSGYFPLTRSESEQELDKLLKFQQLQLNEVL